MHFSIRPAKSLAIDIFSSCNTCNACEVRRKILKYSLFLFFNLIFHGPGLMWPGFFECLQLKNLLSKKIWKTLHSWRSVFSIFFTSGLSPYNDAFLTYSAKRKKNPKMQVIWDLGRGNPATLERKHRTCHVTAPPPPSSDLALSAEGGRERVLDMATNSPNWNVSFKFSKKVNILM